MTVDRRIIRTKKAIKSAFTDMLLQYKNVENISVTKLVERADVSRGTFYLHYTDLYALLGDVENDLIADFIQVLENDEHQLLKASIYPLIYQVTLFARKNHRLISVLVMDRVDLTFVYKIKKVVRAKCYEDWKVLFNSKENELFEYYYAFIFAGMVEIILEWIDQGMKESPESLSRLIGRIIMEGPHVLEA